MRLLAIVAALLITGGVVTVAGSAFADSDSSDGDGGILSSLTSGSDEESGDESSGDESDRSGDGSDGSDGSEGDENGDGDQAQGDDDGQGQDEQAQDEDGGQDGNGDEQGRAEARDRLAQNRAGAAAEAEDPFPGRDQIAPAGRDDYVDINDVEPNGNIGEGGAFNRGSYSVDCGVSDHNNSDNYMAAPGKRNGAQHVHDYVGNRSTNANSDDDSLAQAGTSCVNGDQSVFFWPVVRDLNGTGPDVGEDGGSLDGNVGSILKPRSAQLSFRGHGDQKVEPMPTHLMMIMGNAKQGAQNGANVNAKYTCENTPDRVTDKYPICGETGGRLQRLLDYPSCWDGQNLESANFRDHMAFPDDQGNCSDGFKPIPALRITLTYDQPEGRAFSIDSFPNEQHDPKTDHSDYENIASEDANQAGADCINENRTCANLPQ